MFHVQIKIVFACIDVVSSVIVEETGKSHFDSYGDFEQRPPQPRITITLIADIIIKLFFYVLS